MSAPYSYINGSQAGSNIMYFFQYANSVTGSLFVPAMCVAFFVIILISSLIYQLRFTSRVRFEVSLLASSFALFGFELILLQFNGLIDPIFFIFTIGILILSALWVFMSSE